MHGKLPYPEATAITEVLVTGEKGGSQAKLLLQATAIAGVYDFFVTTFHVWKEYRRLPVRAGRCGRWPIAHAWSFSFDAIGFILGLGYVMGLRSSMILCAGGVLSNFVLVPLIWMIGSHLRRHRGLSGHDPDRAYDRGADLPRLRALHRRGRHRHGRDLRHPEVAADRGRLVRRGAARLPPRRSAAHASAPTATFR